MKRIVSAVAILAVVGGALAFKAKAFTPNVLFCFPATETVSPTASCASQANADNIAWDVVLSGGQTANPCPSISGVQEKIYIQSGSTCTVPAVGTEYLVDPNE